jgi:hypothetical protein
MMLMANRDRVAVAPPEKRFNRAKIVVPETNRAYTEETSPYELVKAPPTSDHVLPLSVEEKRPP